MSVTIDAAAVAALSETPLNWRYHGLPAEWWGLTCRAVTASTPELFAAGAVGPVCTLSDAALDHNVATMAAWCDEHAVELAPHGKTHMAPQLFARQAAAGACAVTVATVSQARVYRAFGAGRLIIANELVDAAGLRWAAADLDADPKFDLVCWVDSVPGVKLMTDALTAAGATRPLDVCVEVGMPGGRTGCRTADEVDAVASAVVASPRLRLVGVAGYEAARGHDVGVDGRAAVHAYLSDVRAAAVRLAARFETDEVMVTAGGSTYFDVVADVLADGPWRTVLRSGCYLTHDEGLYQRTSPLAGLRPALTVWGQVSSRPEPGLAFATLGRRDVSFDQDLPIPRGVPGARVTKLNDQHAYLALDAATDVAVGQWLAFGTSHPCTVFDKWQLIPVLDDAGRVVDLVHTFF